jgi:hypothetical protein
MNGNEMYLPSVDENVIVGVGEARVFEKIFEVRVTSATPALGIISNSQEGQSDVTDNVGIIELTRYGVDNTCCKT